jgi:transposase
MRPHGSPKALEERRRRAVALLKEHRSLHEVARQIGCNPSSVLRWRNAMRRGGPDALRAKPVPGRPCRLKPHQKERLVELLLQGAMAHGYRTELWTTLRIAEVIRRRMGIAYHRNHVGKLLHDLGWSHQKPERRALERDEEAIARWKRRVWPRLKKTPHGWEPICSSSTNRASS